MNSKHVLISIIITLCAVSLYQLINAGRLSYPDYEVSVGQIADFDLAAPFDFPILKTEAQIQQEYQEKMARLGRPHSLNPDAEFEAYSNLDKLFALLYEAAAGGNPEAVAITARQQGFDLGEGYLGLISSQERINNAYRAIRSNLGQAYGVGIYAGAETESLLIVTGSGTQKKARSAYFQLDEAKRLILARLEAPLARLVELNAGLIIKPNLSLDAKKYEELKQEAMASVNTVAGTVPQNEVVIRKNQRVTAEDVNKLNSLTQEYKVRGQSRSALFQLLNLLGLMLYVFAVLLVFNLYLSQSGITGRPGSASFITLNLSLLFLILMAVLGNHFLNLEINLIPFAMLFIAVAILIGFDFAVLYTLAATLLLGPFINWEVYSIAVLLLSTLLTLALIRKFKSRHEFLRIWLFQFFSLNLVNLSLTLYSYNGDDLDGKLALMVRNAGYSLVSTTITVLGCLAIVKYYEKRWNRATKQVLLELLDFNHPLLKRLATEAVGTYHHCLIVGNLAERAAEAIGANPLLARVGSYYHDVGKLSNPDAFTENNEDSAEIHARYSPEESAEIIRNHVQEGAVLAAKYRIPQVVIDIILQHHGTSYIRYFLDAAQKNGDGTDTELFRYPGPLPQSKEAALVMLADIIESTAKAKTGPSEGEIRKIIEDAIQRLIREGLLEQAPITLKDLAVAREVMLPILESIYRKRLDYPEEQTS